MLPAPARVRSPADHREVARRGARGQSGPLTVRVLPAPRSGSALPRSPARAGVVVPVRVGNAVARNTVKRRLRHLLAARRPSWPAGSRIVVRAENPAAVVPSDVLGGHLDAALDRAWRKAGAR